MKQKSSIRGRPTCSTMKFRSGKSVAAWSTSATSKASLSSGQIVGPLWTWMFLIAELLALLQVPVRLGVLERPAARAVPPLGGVELDALASPSARRSRLELLQPASPSRGSHRVLSDELAGVLLGQRAVPLGRVEARPVPLLQVGRLEDRHVDVARPRRRPSSGRPRSTSGTARSASGSRRARAPGRRGSTRSSPWRTAPAPGTQFCGAGVPVVDVAVDDEVLLAVLLVHGSS